jgi:ribosomal protein L40E
MSTANLNPIETSHSISREYRRYLNSLLPISDPKLAKALTTAIAETPTLTRGPYLEATPPHSAGASLRDLITEGVLPEAMTRFGSPELPLDRPLYRHQELATRKARDARNVVVSTGTGSGKTESFLIPIIASLADEIAAGTLGPGVRALLLYPMNALANDQVKRLRRLLAGVPDVTFGRYVGDTAHEKADAEQKFQLLNPGEPRLPNELLSREEMQTSPPNILLTNYAMLEYLLLRPRDMDLFEGAHEGHWQYLVVDEAHVYDGARGSELAMLLRRLRERVGSQTDLRCIATSATVGADTNRSAVTTFAQNLFGSQFEWHDQDPARQDLVFAERDDIPRGSWGPLTGPEYEEISRAKDPEQALLAMAPTNADFESAADALQNEVSMAIARTMLAKGVSTLAAVSERLGSDWEPSQLSHLVNLGSAMKSPDGVPVLSARYHQWVRATEGAFTCLNPREHHLTLARHEHCETCARPVYELAACVRCGTPYLLGQEAQVKGLPPRLEPREGQHDNRTWLALTSHEGEDDEDDDSWETSNRKHQDRVELCTRCGLINPEGSTSCADCGESELRAGRIAASRKSSPNGCVACEGRSESDVRLLDAGQDAANSVVATSLYQRLPRDPGPAGDLPGAGRKLLIFSDSRQGAAFFAPYLENSYQRILQRRLLLRGIRVAGEKEGGPALLDDAIARACDEATAFALFERRTSRQMKEREIGTWLAQELVAIDERQSLEGLGLVRLEIDEPERIAAMPVWDSIGLSPVDGVALVTELLRIVRRQGAVSFPDGVDAADESFKPRLGPIHLRQHKSDNKLLSWSPAPKRSNKRLDYITRILERSGSDSSPPEVLDGLWRFLTSGEDPLLCSVSHPRHGVVRQVDYTWLRARALDEGEVIYQCDQCRRWAGTSVQGVCPGYRCTGTLEQRTIDPVDADDSHYRGLYRNLEPIPMSVKEHTAQWRAQEAAEIQTQFVRGTLNALSCSTTFELGVDVGELQAVLLKNVPPRTANYIQRAGRAGRRTASAALVVTMAQRRSHDLTQFAEPEKMISGIVTAPVIPLGNARIDRRHAHSVILSAFFRHAWTERGLLWRKSGEFFNSAQGAPVALELLKVYLTDYSVQLSDELARTLPNSVHDEIGLGDGSWVPFLNKALENVRAEVAQEVAHFEEARQRAFDEKKDSVAAMFGKIVRTVEQRDLLGMLGSRNILPKYGFPSDVVELKTSLSQHTQGGQLNLSRDLGSAIYEYAPGSEIVAGGLKWKSAGIYRQPSKDLVKGWMAECSECGHFERSLAPLEGACKECASLRKVNEFTIPEFGFIADRKAEKPGSKSPDRSWNGSTHHLGSGDPTGEEIETKSTSGASWLRQPSARARMVAVSKGSGGGGFIICDWCGRGWAAARGGFKASHQHAWKDQDCTGSLAHTWLAHEFETDVLTISVGPPDHHSMSALWSTLYALLEGASEELSISRDDIDGTVSLSRSQVKLVLFDTVPGGAGGALRISESFDAIVKRSLQMVSGCECGEETSCYSCLRSYRNQTKHDVLARGTAIEMLNAISTSA